MKTTSKKHTTARLICSYTLNYVHIDISKILHLCDHARRAFTHAQFQVSLYTTTLWIPVVYLQQGIGSAKCLLCPATKNAEPI